MKRYSIMVATINKGNCFFVDTNRSWQTTKTASITPLADLHVINDKMYLDSHARVLDEVHYIIPTRKEKVGGFNLSVVQ